MKRWTLWLAGLVATVIFAVTGAIAFGGPKEIAALDSINQPFEKVDYSRAPPAKTYQARDGVKLAYHHYIAENTNAATRRIVLVHGSSARGRSMHPLAQALAAQGFTVDALDMRGHGDSGKRGQINYVGQLEDDIADFIKTVPHAGPNTLLGFSAGGGFVLRFAASQQQTLFDRYVLLSPYLHYKAPTAKPNNGNWVSIGLPRVIALSVINKLGITNWNHLEVTRFALNNYAKTFLTPAYGYALATNFGPHADYAQDIKNARGSMQIVVGSEDELFEAGRFNGVFEQAGKKITVTTLPGIDHMGLTLQQPAIEAIAKLCQS